MQSYMKFEDKIIIQKQELTWFYTLFLEANRKCTSLLSWVKGELMSGTLCTHRSYQRVDESSSNAGSHITNRQNETTGNTLPLRLMGEG